ncbi:MAG: aromatic amino acid lyase, partial [Myxococcota bacterium]
MPLDWYRLAGPFPDRMDSLRIDGQSLRLEDVAKVAFGGVQVSISEDAGERVARARALVDAEAASGRAVYGVNTGFGFLSRVRIPHDDLAQLQLNLIRSHSVGVGDPLNDREVRALMLLRANVMATGRSGVRIETLQLLVDMLNRDILPVVPSKGSVGASGDLAPLAHIALAMIGEGPVKVDGRILRGADALAQFGLST